MWTDEHPKHISMACFCLPPSPAQSGGRLTLWEVIAVTESDKRPTSGIHISGKTLTLAATRLSPPHGNYIRLVRDACLHLFASCSLDRSLQSIPYCQKQSEIIPPWLCHWIMLFWQISWTSLRFMWPNTDSLLPSWHSANITTIIYGLRINLMHWNALTQVQPIMSLWL